MASAEREDCYKMSAKPRGMCVIIENFTDEGDDDNISHFTESKLVETFEKLHLTVTYHRNLTAAAFLKVMQDLSEADHSAYDCVVVFIDAHGDNGVVVTADNYDVPIEDLRSFLKAENCKSLAGKPKLFFIDACRGKEEQIPVKLMPKGEDEVDAAEPYYVSNDADFFLGFATTESYYAYDGLRFYKEIVSETFNERADRDHLLDMMTEVNRKMAENTFQEGNVDKTIKVQTSEIRSTLTKKVFFK